MKKQFFLGAVLLISGVSNLQASEYLCFLQGQSYNPFDEEVCEIDFLEGDDKEKDLVKNVITFLASASQYMECKRCCNIPGTDKSDLVTVAEACEDLKRGAVDSSIQLKENPLVLKLEECQNFIGFKNKECRNLRKRIHDLAQLPISIVENRKVVLNGKNVKINEKPVTVLKEILKLNN